MRDIGDIAVDVDDMCCRFIADAGAVGLADRSRSDHDHQLSMLHGIISADRSLRSTHMHVAGIPVSENAARTRREHHHGVGRLREATNSGVMTASSTARLDHDARMAGYQTTGDIERIRGRGCNGGQIRLLRQGREVDIEHLRLRVDGQQQIERTGFIGMEDPAGTTSQRFPQRLGRMQRVGLADIRGHPSVDALHRLRHLLHIVAFAEGRLVSVDVIDADTVGCRRERSCQRLQCPRSNRGDDRWRLSVGPSQCGCGVRHLDFVATIDRLGHTFFVIDPQHVADVGRTMTEDGKECGHLLLQEPQNQGFRKRDLYRSRQGTVRQGLVEASSRMNRPCARANL